ncbi:MAG: hypothetical protein AB1420_03385 [Bacillota bacterium]
MNIFCKKSFVVGLTILGLMAWSSITLVLMLTRSWTAANAYWVSLFTGLICISAAIAVYSWRLLVIDDTGGDESGE